MNDFPKAVWALRIALALIRLVIHVFQRGGDATDAELEEAKRGAFAAHQAWENVSQSRLQNHVDEDRNGEND